MVVVIVMIPLVATVIIATSDRIEAVKILISWQTGGGVGQQGHRKVDATVDWFVSYIAELTQVSN